MRGRARQGRSSRPCPTRVHGACLRRPRPAAVSAGCAAQRGRTWRGDPGLSAVALSCGRACYCRCSAGDLAPRRRCACPCCTASHRQPSRSRPCGACAAASLLSAGSYLALFQPQPPAPLCDSCVELQARKCKLFPYVKAFPLLALPLHLLKRAAAVSLPWRQAALFCLIHLRQLQYRLPKYTRPLCCSRAAMHCLSSCKRECCTSLLATGTSSRQKKRRSSGPVANSGPLHVSVRVSEALIVELPPAARASGSATAAGS
jgi:hypothetical protein